MPTTYKPTTDHSPLDWGDAAERIKSFLHNSHQALKTFASDRGDDALEAWREQIESELIRFVAFCRARPLRTPNKLVGTLRKIVRDPEHFLQHVNAYDPEVADRLYAAYSQHSPAHNQELLRFEAGLGKLSKDALSLAANEAIERLGREKEQQKSIKGENRRPPDTVLQHFTEMVLQLFISGGGTPTATRDGKFWKFATLLREAVKQDIRLTGSGFMIEPVVRRGVTIMKKSDTQ
jgi:hypothetical protein